MAWRRVSAWPSVLKVMLGLVALATALLLGLVTWYWSAYEITSWRTWGVRLSHRVLLAHQGDLGVCEVQFVLRPRENPEAAVRACAQAFERELHYDHVRINCVAFGSAADARVQADHPGLRCERARAVQWPYARASNAEIIINTGERCGTRERTL